MYKILVYILIVIFISCSPLSAKVVGVLTTNMDKYDGETGGVKNIIKIMQDRFDHDFVIIDYNTIVNASLKVEALDRAHVNKNYDEIQKLLYGYVIECLKKRNIEHIIIFGNNYNIHHTPCHPNENRNQVSHVMGQLASEGKIALVGLCGGMQSVMDYHGIKLERVINLMSVANALNHRSIGTNVNPTTRHVNMNVLRLKSDSMLAKIIGKYSSGSERGGFLLYMFPDFHKITVDTSKENLEILSKAGFTVTGFSDDDMVEVVEDKFGNIHFEMHPEYVLRESYLVDKNGKISFPEGGPDYPYKEEYRKNSISSSVAFFKHFFNRVPLVKL